MSVRFTAPIVKAARERVTVSDVAHTVTIEPDAETFAWVVLVDADGPVLPAMPPELSERVLAAHASARLIVPPGTGRIRRLLLLSARRPCAAGDSALLLRCVSAGLLSGEAVD
jgi:hypothetical protein